MAGGVTASDRPLVTGAALRLWAAWAATLGEVAHVDVAGLATR